MLDAALSLNRDVLQNTMRLHMWEEEDRGRGERTERTIWVREWLSRRPEFGIYEQLMEELRREDVAAFKNFMRVDPPMFQEIVDRLTPRLQKTDTWYRKALCPGLKVAITMRYLASGDSYHSLMYSFRVAHNTISKVVSEVCEAIIAEYAEEVINPPTEEEEWRDVANQYGTKWQFHHVLGALDGKHVRIRCPRGGGSTYFNFKGYHSIVLLGLVDADYKFMWVNVGAPGSCSDAQIWNQCDLREHIMDETVHIPAADPLPGDDKDTPYFIIADDAPSVAGL